MRKGRRRAPYWNRERVIEGLQRFARNFGQTPTATEKYQALQQFTGARQSGVGNPYPSSASVLRHFSSFRQAWAACGIAQNRDWEEWSPEEDWFISEGAGLLSRNEMAAYLGRTPNAVHRRLYDMGIDSRQARGWTMHRAAVATGVPDCVLRGYLLRGDIPYLRGVKCLFFDPAELLVVREINWAAITPELAQAIRQSLMARLVALLSGRAWRASSPYTRQVARVTGKRWSEAKRQQTWQPPPYALAAGEAVRLKRRLPDLPSLERRRARVIGVYFSRNKQAKLPQREGLGPCWVARLEFKRWGELPRVLITLPLYLLCKINLTGGKANEQIEQR
jgi:hypothetical protein